MKYDVFISYRREGGYDTAKHLNDLLLRDGYNVSFDIDTLRSGDFDTQLLERIDQCKDFILIVDQHAFDRTLDPKFNSKNDWLRCELAYALKKGKNIVPVFLSGVTGFPTNLPNDVVGVVTKNGPEYNRYHFNAFYEDLKKRFIKSKSKSKQNIYLQFAIVITLIVMIGYWYFDYKHTNEGSDVAVSLSETADTKAYKNSIVDLQEVHSSSFQKNNENETVRMSYDLDGNGETDYLKYTYWDRWDKVLFSIMLSLL